VRDILNRILTPNKKAEEPVSSTAGHNPGLTNSATDQEQMPLSQTPAITGAEEENQTNPDDLDVTEESETTEPDGFFEADMDIGKTVPLRPLPENSALTETLIGKRPQPGSDDEPMMRVAQSCHVGSIRARNEDSCLVFLSQSGGQEPLLPFGLYIVADGMGGHFAGHEASKQVSRMVAAHVLNQIYLPLLQSDGKSAGSRQPIQEILLQAVQSANMNIYTPDPERESGTTLTAALVFGRRLYLAHVGDSRAYILAEGKLEQVTTDHSYVRRLQEAGQLTAEEAASHPQRNVLYRAVGQGDELEIDISTRPLPKRGKLILCSDGLWGLVPEPMMQDILERDQPLQKMVDTLVEIAIQAGGHDNITGVLVDFNL
jgi:serine/threonine protein phosphatase PrpC